MSAREIKYMDPNNLLIVGLDCDEEGSPLIDVRADWEVDPNLVKNIMVYGVLHPVHVRREAGKIYVVDGRQRVKACRAAAELQQGGGEYITKCPTVEVLGDDRRVVGIMISANELRQDDPILVKAAKAARLHDMGEDRESIALTFGRSQKTIGNWMKLLQADPKVHAAIREGKISAAVGIKLSSKSRQEQILALDQMLMPSPATSNTSTNGVSTASTASSSTTPTSTSSSSKEHAGIKKGWIRKAMKTTAYANLDPQEQQVFQWILTGTAPKDHWLDTFTWGVDEEMSSHE